MGAIGAIAGAVGGGGGIASMAGKALGKLKGGGDKQGGGPMQMLSQLLNGAKG